MAFEKIKIFTTLQCLISIGNSYGHFLGQKDVIPFMSVGAFHECWCLTGSITVNSNRSYCLSESKLERREIAGTIAGKRTVGRATSASSLDFAKHLELPHVRRCLSKLLPLCLAQR